MSTWGCYFCCVFLIFFSFFFFSFFAMWSVYYFSFLKKILNVFQKKKNDKKPVLIQDFVFVPQKISKMETKPKKASKSWAGSFFFFSFFFFIYTVEERDKLEMDTVEHTASTILVVQMVTKERTLSIPYWSFGCLQATWISVGAVLFFCFIFFCSHMRRVGFASALLP